MLRREFLAFVAALTASPALSQEAEKKGLQLSDGAAFDPNDVLEMARRLAQSPYVAPTRIPEEWTEIDYEDYVSIWFDVRNALWNDEPDTPLRLDVFAPGLYFPVPINISVVEEGIAQPLAFDFDLFDKTDKFPDLPVDETLGYSGLRLRADLEKQGIY